MIKCIYAKCLSCISNKGRNSKYFNISRGIRQGCALSALLFILSVEILACNIRHNKNIKGFQMPEGKVPSNMLDQDTEVKISQVADDTTIFTKDNKSTLEVIQEVKHFSAVSGLQLNMSKTEGILLNVDAVQTEQIHIKWTSGPVKSLGIYFGLDKIEIQRLNWESKLDKLKRVLSVWRKRDLTLYGRSVVLKSLALSKMYYNMSVIVTPDYVIKGIESEIFNFLWKGKKDKIKRTCLIGDYTEGGLKITDVRSQQEALYCNWVKRLIYTDYAKWKIIPFYYLNLFGEDALIFKMNFESSSVFPRLTLECSSEFYRKVVEFWHKSHTNYNYPVSVDDIKKEIIWGNKYIICDRFCLFMKHWIDSDIIYIDDICNLKGFLKPNSIKQKLVKKTNFLCEYYLILQSIPKRWRTALKQNENRKVFFDRNLISWNTNCYSVQSISKISSKIIYLSLVKDKVTRCYCEQSWNRLFEDDINWSSIWVNQTKHLTDNMKMAEFNYKILHQILPSGKLLHRWCLAISDLCILCQSIDDYEHMFVSCMRVKNLWIEISNLFEKAFNLKINITLKTIIIGNHSITDVNLHKFINTVLTIVKYTIFKSWCRHRLDKKLLKNANILHLCKLDLQYHLETEICRKGVNADLLCQLLHYM